MFGRGDDEPVTFFCNKACVLTMLYLYLIYLFTIPERWYGGGGANTRNKQ